MNESKNVRKNVSMMLTGMVIGAALTGGSIAVAAGITAEPTWQPIFVDGQQVEMQAYNIAGHNYVKLRDMGEQVGFNVYWNAGVQIDTGHPYTGIAPAASGIRVSSYKGSTLRPVDEIVPLWGQPHPARPRRKGGALLGILVYVYGMYV